MTDQRHSADNPDQPAHQAVAASGPSGWRKLGLLAAIVAALFTCAKLLPVDQYLGQFLHTVRSLGPWGPVLLAGAYVVATVLMVPGVILTLGAGFLFGLWTGVAVVSLASVAGAICAFLVGRRLARSQVEERAKKYPRFAAIDQAVDQAGFKIVLLTRLSPLFPFNALNYLFSVTKVRLRDYALASWIGMLPGTFMYVYFGAAAKSLAAVARGEYEGGLAEKAFFAAGLVVTITVTWYVTRLARRAVRQYVPEKPAPAS